MELFQLTATGGPEPGIQLFWDTQRHRAILHGYRLRQVPQDRAYQLWVIKDGTPVPSITFRPEPDGHAKVERIPVPEDGPLGCRRGNGGAIGRVGAADLAPSPRGEAAAIVTRRPTRRTRAAVVKRS